MFLLSELSFLMIKLTMPIMKQKYLFVLEGLLYILGGLQYSLNYFSSKTGVDILLVTGTISMSAGAVLTSLNLKRQDKIKLFRAQLVLALGLLITGLSSYLSANIYTDLSLATGILLIAASTVYLWSKYLIPTVKENL